MALFFDQAWFDARLAERGLARADLARLLGLTANQIAEMWKDQREVAAEEVLVMARLFGQPPEEVAARAGVSTPTPPATSTPADASLAALEARLVRIERGVAELKTLLLAALTPRD